MLTADLFVRVPNSPLEYPCWLLQSVLLQGYLYITAKHICFYAYLPKKAVNCAQPNEPVWETTISNVSHSMRWPSRGT
jgi:hypothetical protein